MVIYNLYLVLNHETIMIYDKATQSIVYEGPSESIPDGLMSELVHDMTIVHVKHTNRAYFLININ